MDRCYGVLFPCLYHEDDEDHIHLGGAGGPVAYISEEIELLSVGVDIGSSTSHLVFSRLALERQGQRLSSRYMVTQREIVYQSPVILTPYAEGGRINARRLEAFVEEAYEEAGWDREDVDAGAVITTGEAALRENAGAIVDLFSAEAGRFVCAAAGPNLEGMLAAHGSAAVEFSRESAEPTLNIDIGGGTTKFALCRNGKVEQTAALHLGARLLGWDSRGRLTRIEDAGRRLAGLAGVEGRLELGEPLPEEALERLAARMAELVLAVAAGELGEDGLADLWITPALAVPEPARRLVFSGGVAEYVYGREEREFGDLGPRLGAALGRLAGESGARLLEPREGIRATCIGASQYTVQVSGDTIFLSDPDVLPMRSAVVAAVRGIDSPATRSGVANAVCSALARLDMHEDSSAQVALGIHWHHGADYASLYALGAGLIDAMKFHLEAGRALVLVVDADIAGTVGSLLQRELNVGVPIVCVDQVLLREFDYVDIGRPLPEKEVVPVVIKSLVFH
jgi:ethanolamine utilization protein EutA